MPNYFAQVFVRQYRSDTMFYLPRENKKLLVITLMISVFWVPPIETSETVDQKLERSSKEPGYEKLLQKYYAQASSQSRAPASIQSTEKNKLPPSLFSKLNIRSYKGLSQYAGMIFFKRGDLRNQCQSLVKKVSQLGFDGVAFFYPVHYSGGNSTHYRMSKRPIYGKDYRYEYANRPRRDELNRCLKMISDAGMKLHFIPHLESIKTLISPTQAEWRLESGIIPDEHYFNSSFTPLLQFLSKHKKSFKSGKDLKITLFSEIDPLVLTHPKKVLRLQYQLRKELRKLRLRNVKLYYNTNGDFYNGWQQEQVSNNYSCRDINRFLKNVHGLSPSIYGEKGHIHDGIFPTMRNTTELYLSRLNKKLKELCPKTSFNLSHLEVNFGEFALDPNNPLQDYRSFFTERHKRNHFVQYWNHSKWDHHGLTLRKGPLEYGRIHQLFKKVKSK